MATEKRLSDLDKLVSEFMGRKVVEVFPDWESMSEATHAAVIRFARKYREIILQAPTVDAVKVVRCKDCKHYRSYGPGTDGFESFGKCLLIDMDVDMPVNGYCCYGERRDANDKML